MLPLFLQLTGLTIAALTDPYIKKKHRTVMLVIIVFVCSLLAQNFFEYTLTCGSTRIFARTVVSIYGYCVRPLILTLYLFIVGKKETYLSAWILTGINALIHLTALFSGICFRIDGQNHYIRGPLGYSCHVVSTVLLIYLAYLTVKECARANKREIVLSLSNIP